MPAAVEALLAFILAGVLALLLVPLTDRLARRIGAIDHPDDERSLHAAPTPRLGGLAIFVAVLAAALIWLPWDAETRAIVAGAALITAVGMLDDMYELNAATKLLGQTAAVIVPVSAGVTVDSFTVPFLGQLNPGSVEL
ncbi:MAG TPA: undecaprenyl/decaprenyl-phosphate alpha-N-acetylglucosaminyl 1-phosphate transferase, partial [Solirubrobacterales bacterium]